MAAKRDKDLPLREDIRQLGHLLGRTLREQEGADLFHAVEEIRQTAVRFRRHGDVAARTHLATLLNALDIETTISVVRAFSYFSHLANLAEGQPHKRRRRVHLLGGS